jgi:sulfite reductase (NADPH) hemoprotein beta-component
MTSLISTYVEQRTNEESFIETYRRLGVTLFKEAAYKNNGKHSKESGKGATA